jgi:tRNA(fMet)-specific endonuclease VapC
VILDTCYFIDAERSPLSVRALQVRLASNVQYTTVITWGELAEGYDHPTLERLRTMTLNMPLLGIDESVAMIYGRIRRDLRRRGLGIGPNDLWIAAIALGFRMPVITRNLSEFERVPGLQVIGY